MRLFSGAAERAQDRAADRARPREVAAAEPEQVDVTPDEQGVLSRAVTKQGIGAVMKLSTIDLSDEPSIARQPPAEVPAAEERAIRRGDDDLQFVRRDTRVDAVEPGERLQG